MGRRDLKQVLNPEKGPSTPSPARSRNTGILLIDCPDAKGIVLAVADFLYRHQANIVHADQHQDIDTRTFFMRVEWELDGFQLPVEEFTEKFSPIAGRFGMRWHLRFSATKLRMAIFASALTHCLSDLLHRQETSELRCDIPLLISNHKAGERLAQFHNIPFHFIPVSPDTKSKAEAQQLELLEQHKIDLIVLARYMQILSPQFVSKFPQGIINVHHSFLPAFSGAKPYHQAYKRGVKIIGATSHYVTDVLDDGPIIEQDVLRVSHRDQPDDLPRKGRDLEKIVLARAVRWHLEHRILVYGNKTVIFD